MAFSKIQSVQLTGLSAVGVTVETNISRRLYLFQTVGLSDKIAAICRKIKALPSIISSRTIADLDHSDTIEERHILEALQYRPKLD